MTVSPAVPGILLSAVAFFLFTCFDTTTKFLSRDYSVFQIMGVEFATATAMLLLFVLARNGNGARSPLVMNRPSLHLLRGVLQILGQTLVFLAIPHLSLAEFYVIVFCMPIVAVLQARFFLKERADASIWPVLALNFAGVLIALRPDQGASAWALAAFAGAFILAGSFVLLRKMMESETPEMAAITASAALAMGALAVTPFVYKPVAALDLAMMAAGGLLFAPAQIMLCASLRLVPAALASPPQFLQLVYGALGGYLVFGDAPTPWVWVGGALVIAANAFLLFTQSANERPKIV